MNLKFSGEVYYWRGPSPFYFVNLPDDLAKKLKAEASRLTYGWGVIPCTVKVGRVEFTTSLFPKGDTYAVPVKAAVRKQLELEVDDVVLMTLSFG